MTHRLVDVPDLAPAVGFSHAVVAAPGRTVYLAGQTAQAPDGAISAIGIVEQFDLALANLLAALRAAGGEGSDLVSMQLFVTSVADYRASLEEIGRAYRRRMGAHYPAMGLFEVSALYDPAALVELMAIAVLPDAPAA